MATEQGIILPSIIQPGRHKSRIQTQFCIQRLTVNYFRQRKNKGITLKFKIKPYYLCLACTRACACARACTHTYTRKDNPALPVLPVQKEESAKEAEDLVPSTGCPTGLSISSAQKQTS